MFVTFLSCLVVQIHPICVRKTPDRAWQEGMPGHSAVDGTRRACLTTACVPKFSCMRECELRTYATVEPVLGGCASPEI